MVRSRLFSLGVAAALGLACGCSSMSNHPLFGKNNCREGCGCSPVQVESGALVEGPILEDRGPYGPTSPSCPSCGAGGAGLAPQVTVPPLNPAPRLVPQATPWRPE